MGSYRDSSSYRRALAVLVAGMVIGTILLTPAGAHIGDSIAHLWGDHIKSKADARYLLKDEVAANADKLDGINSSKFIQGKGSIRASSGILTNDGNFVDLVNVPGIGVFQGNCYAYDATLDERSHSLRLDPATTAYNWIQVDEAKGGEVVPDSKLFFYDSAADTRSIKVNSGAQPNTTSVTWRALVSASTQVTVLYDLSQDGAGNCVFAWQVIISKT